MKVGYYQKEFLVKLFKTVLFFIVGIAFLLPLLWMISSSLKTPAEIFAQEFRWIPENPRWGNYVTVWSDAEVSMARGYLNSAFIAVMSITVSLAFSSLAAYAFAKLEFKGKDIAFMLLLSTMMMPGEVTLIPRFMLFHKIGLYNNHWAVILPHWFAPGAIFMLRQFYRGLPDDLMDAAKIDGAGRWKQTVHITLPCIVPTIITMLILRVGQILGVGHEKILLLYNDATAPVAEVISTYVYKKGLLSGDYSFSTAVGLFNTVINVIFLLTVNQIVKKMNEGQGL